MRNVAVDNTVAHCLANDVFCVLLRIEVQLDTDVTEGNARVGQG